MTQEQLAEKCGTTKTYISRIENDASDIRLSTLLRIIREGLGGQINISITDWVCDTEHNNVHNQWRGFWVFLYFSFQIRFGVVGQKRSRSVLTFRFAAFSSPPIPRHSLCTGVVCKCEHLNWQWCFKQKKFFFNSSWLKKSAGEIRWISIKSLRWDRGKFALSNGWPRVKDLGRS